MSLNRPRRLPRFSYVGFYRYSLTICVHPRRRLFVSDAVVDPIRTQLLTTARNHGFAVFVFCFMPDHLHALVVGEAEDADLKRFVAEFKQASAYHFKRAAGERLWAPGYFDRVLREDEPTEDVARYILENPIRAGLVQTVEMYLFSGSDVMPIRDIAYGVQIRSF